MATSSPLDADSPASEVRRRLLLSVAFLGAVTIAVAFSPNFGFIDIPVRDGRIASAHP